jgi:Cu-processing system permease protein
MRLVHRVLAILWNTYREAVRARLLHGLFALALATAGYALIVAQYASRNAARVVSDLGAASLSIYALVAAIVLGASSLHRELELKTLFPILARPIRRSEYLVGKFFGMVLTLAVFIVGNAATLLLCLTTLDDERRWIAPALMVGTACGLGALGWWRRGLATALPLFGGVGLLCAAVYLTRGMPIDRSVILASALLAVLEVCIIVALATFFSAFSSPFLSAVFTFGVFIVGRSADTLAKLPARVFGELAHDAGALLSHLLPNLMVYVPPRPLLAGETATVELMPYLGQATLQAAAWSAGLLVLASAIFRKRDFT